METSRYFLVFFSALLHSNITMQGRATTISDNGDYFNLNNFEAEIEKQNSIINSVVIINIIELNHKDYLSSIL